MEERPLSGHPQIESVDHAFGLAYVLEGSTLGGAVLAERVRCAGFEGCRNTEFLVGYGPDRGLMWRRFRNILEERLSTEASIARAESGASAGFDLFLRQASRMAGDAHTDMPR